jgi:hypothetical protein
MIGYRTYFLFCQDEKTTFFELGEAPNASHQRPNCKRSAAIWSGFMRLLCGLVIFLLVEVSMLLSLRNNSLDSPSSRG